MKWRLLVEENRRPEYNMAVDEALLATFEASGPPTLRLYSWQPAAVSIGYFQPADSGVATDAPIVRRMTGGGAISHAGDFTYSVVVGKSDPITSPSLYNSVHEAISNALHHLGIDARPRWATKAEDSPVGWDRRGPFRGGATLGENDAAVGTALAAVWRVAHEAAPFFCSARHADADLVVGAKKILGSAQRKSRAAILQHGSMPIEDAACDALMTSVRRETGRPVTFRDLVPLVTDSFRSLFGIVFQQGQLSDQERGLAERLAKGKYGSPEWNYRR